MSKNRYSEEEAVQKPAGNLLATLGWDVHYCFDEEVLGPHGTLGRESYHDVLLRRDLESALTELNEWMDEADVAEAIKTLEHTFVGDSLLQINEAKYNMLRDGIPVRKLNADGTPRTELAQVFDFEHPKMNRFVAAEELWVHGPLHRRRCDLVGFVNGVPLVFMEFKRQDKDVERAYRDNYADYQDAIPQIFHFNAFVILSNGLQSRVGTLGSPYEFFHEWKRLREEDAGSVSLETMLRGVCDRETLLDVFQNFILFDHFDTPAAKIMARNHQYLGVNEALGAYKARRLNDGKLACSGIRRVRAKVTPCSFWPRRSAARSLGRPPSWYSPTEMSSTNRSARHLKAAGVWPASLRRAAAQPAGPIWRKSSGATPPTSSL